MWFIFLLINEILYLYFSFFELQILPQAICSRYGLAVGAALAPVVRVLLLVFFPVAYPISKVFSTKTLLSLRGKPHLKLKHPCVVVLWKETKRRWLYCWMLETPQFFSFTLDGSYSSKLRDKVMNWKEVITFLSDWKKNILTQFYFTKDFYPCKRK